MRKIAILAKCSNTRADAPMYDPTWEKWGLAWDPLPICSRYFEMHAFWRNFRDDPDDAEEHRRWLMGQKIPVYMRQVEHDIPNSVAYPFDEVGKLIKQVNGGVPYLESSIAFMLALAIYEKPDRIGIWGVDMGTTTEYYYQRPNMEYLIGFGRGLGIPIFAPPDCALMKPAHSLPYGIWEAARPAT